jgi:hypothetical protein
LLGVARIMDPVQSRGKKNITLRAIAQHLRDSKLRSDFDRDIESLSDISEFCRDWRNRWIAHIDYELSVSKENARPLEVATRNKFHLTIKKIHALYNRIELKYLGSTTVFEIIRSNGAVSLLYRIEDGLRFDQDVYEQKIRGSWKSDDFKSRV